MGSLKRKSLLIMFVLYLEDWIHWYFLLLLIQLVWFIIFVLSIYQSCSIFLTSLLLFSLELAIFSHFTFWNLLSINLTLFFNILLQSILKFNFNTAPSSRTNAWILEHFKPLISSQRSYLSFILLLSCLLLTRRLLQSLVWAAL